MRSAGRTIAEFLRAAGPADDGAARAWRVAILAMLAARHLERPVDLGRVLEMALVQALPGLPGRIRDRLDPDNGLHLHALFLELTAAGTSEARLVHALGDLLDDRDAGCRDRFLRDLADALCRHDGRRSAAG